MPSLSLDFFQIYYKKEQLSQLYPFARPYLNRTLTPYFENSVISTLVPGSNADLISIASWKLRQKRNQMPSMKILTASKSLDLTIKSIRSKKFDVAILTPRDPNHKTLFMASHWHGEVWSDTFLELSSFLRNNLNCQIPRELKFAIYGNHFIAKRHIYMDYIQSCLNPTIKFMDNNDTYFMRPAGYRRSKENLSDFASISEYESTSGRTDWPICTFLLERLFSIWINNKNLHVTYL
jgi:hypothetical protein